MSFFFFCTSNHGRGRHPENYTPRPSLGRAGRQSSLPEQRELRRSALTLQDSQQVVVLHREAALGVLAATQNYLSNFKDNGGDDDDDYVEIRSEDESEGERGGAGGGGGRRRCSEAQGSAGLRSGTADPSSRRVCRARRCATATR